MDNSTLRKMQPVGTVETEYFPDALRGVAAVAWVGNEKHNPGEPLHWAKEKSTDHVDCMSRHTKDAKRGDGWDIIELPDRRRFAVRHTAAAAWRALAIAQLDIEANGGEVIRVLDMLAPPRAVIPGREDLGPMPLTDWPEGVDADLALGNDDYRRAADFAGVPLSHAGPPTVRLRDDVYSRVAAEAGLSRYTAKRLMLSAIWDLSTGELTENAKMALEARTEAFDASGSDVPKTG